MAPVESSGRTDQKQQESQLVTFYLGNEEFGFDIMSVQEIIRQPALSRIPMAPEYVERIGNLRGTVLPIIDTRSRFGMKREDETDHTRVLVVDVDGVKTGLRVDRVRQVTRIQAGDAEPPPAVIRSGMSSEFLKGVVKLEGGKRIIMSLSPGAICKVDLTGASASTEQAEHHQADRAPRQDKQETAANQSVAQVVSFKLGQEEYAFPMERVREILRVERPNEVPDTPAYCLGILTVRGNILPVIDLRSLLGMRELADDVKAAASATRHIYEGWLASLENHVRDKTAPNPGDRGAEALRSWIGGFTTSSQTLMETLSAMRVANDKVIRACHRLTELFDTENAQDYFNNELSAFAQESLRQLTALDEQIVENIREDQRLVVVQTTGALLALLVDKVREVLNVPTSLIDPPPRIGNTDAGSEIRGVARLEDGKRLIMLLNADRLVTRDGIDAVNRATGESMQPQARQSLSARTTEQRGVESERQFVTFRLADGEYGIPINEIQEIDRSSKMTRIPKAPDYVDGVTNLRGEVIPVINARRRFSLPLKEADERTRVIIIDVAGRKTGLLVDSVREVLNLPLTEIAPPPATISSGIHQQYIAGVGKVDNGKRMLVLLDVSKVVGAEVQT